MDIRRGSEPLELHARILYRGPSSLSLLLEVKGLTEVESVWFQVES